MFVEVIQTTEQIDEEIKMLQKIVTTHKDTRMQIEALNTLVAYGEDAVLPYIMKWLKEPQTLDKKVSALQALKELRSKRLTT
jgi:DNA helicase TIP49 (TBP-interacting protein)